jgi:hypothetical protein
MPDVRPEIREVYEMVTEQKASDPGALERQRTRQIRAMRNRRGAVYGVVAAMIAALVAVILGAEGSRGPTPGPGTQPASTAERVASSFVRSYGTLDAERALTYLADDADISALVTSLGDEGLQGSTDELPLFLSMLRAMGYEQGPPDCESGGSGSDTRVSCTFDFHLLGSQEIGRDPYSGSYFDLTVRDGQIVRASISWQTNEFSPQMWEPFAGWVSAAHPNDAAAMYDDATYSGATLTKESIGLWRQRVGEYVNAIASNDPLPVGRNSRVVEGVEFSFSVPDAAWGAFGSVSINKSIVGPQGAEAIIFWTTHPDGDDAQPDDVDPCENLLDAPPVPTTADLAAAVSTAPGTELVAGPSVVTVGGYPAQHVVVTVREDLGCDPGYFYRWQTMWWGALWPHTNVGDTIRVWIVDVGGTRLFLEAETSEQADVDLEQEIEEIIGSIRFA